VVIVVIVVVIVIVIVGVAERGQDLADEPARPLAQD
jgi:hypothetical protein